MRSKVFCLFVLLTSVVPNLANTCTSAADDCTDKPLTADDVKWTFDTAFNERKHIPIQNKDFVEVDFNRALYLDSATSKPVKLYTDNVANCKNVLIRNTDKDTLNLDFSASPFSITVTVEKPTVVAVFDPECRLRAKMTEIKDLTVKHQFTRNLKSEPLPEIFLKDTLNGNRVLGHYTFAQHDEYESVPPNVKDSNNFYPFRENNKGAKKECFHKCKTGHLFEFKLFPGTAFAHTFKMRDTCKWMNIFVNDEKDYNMAGAEVSLRHGFVTLPTEVKAFPMDFETSVLNSAEEEHKYAVSVLYTVNQEKAELIITNSHGQAVRSHSVMPSTETIFFGFSDDNCLTDVIGTELVKTTDTPQKLSFKNHEFANILNLGYLVATFHIDQEFNSWRYSDTDEAVYTHVAPTEPYTDKQPAKVTGVPYTIVTGVATNSHPTTNTLLTSGTDPTRKDESMTPEQIDAMNKLMKEEAERELALLRAMQGHYYFHWAIPAGFSAGSIASFIICNIIMFVMRRSVCTFWYKAMYKRYGTDTTMGGTTMGKTGGGETIGGGTTAGGTTAGGTTAGETVGSTTAA